MDSIVQQQVEPSLSTTTEKVKWGGLVENAELNHVVGEKEERGLITTL